MPVKFTVNTRAFSSDAPPRTPLLWVIREGDQAGPAPSSGCGARVVRRLPAWCTSTANALFFLSDPNCPRSRAPVR